MSKNMYQYDERSVLTLDAGGTNLVFNAVQANREIVEPVVLPTHADDLDKFENEYGKEAIFRTVLWDKVKEHLRTEISMSK